MANLQEIIQIANNTPINSNLSSETDNDIFNCPLSYYLHPDSETGDVYFGVYQG